MQVISTSTVVALGSAAVLAGVYAAVANSQIDTSAPEVDALLRAIGFSPYGAVMIWIGLGVRRTMAKVEDQFEQALAVARDYVTATQEMAKAVRERTVAEQTGTAAQSRRLPRHRE